MTVFSDGDISVTKATPPPVMPVAMAKVFDNFETIIIRWAQISFDLILSNLRTI